MLPRDFVTNTLRAVPNEWQITLLDAIGSRLGTTQRHAIAGGRSVGKTTVTSWVALWALAQHENARIVITAATEAQLFNNTVPCIKMWFDRLAITHEFTFREKALINSDSPHTWRADFIPWTLHNPEFFAGLMNAGQLTVIIIDEASPIPEVIWRVLEGVLDEGNIFLALGIPSAPGHFKNTFSDSNWVTQHIDSRSVAHVNQALLQQLAEDYGAESDFFKIHVRGLFPDEK